MKFMNQVEWGLNLLRAPSENIQSIPVRSYLELLENAIKVTLPFKWRLYRDSVDEKSCGSEGEWFTLWFSNWDTE